MLNRIYSLLTFIILIMFLIYIFVDAQYKELLNAFILRALIFSKIQLIYIFKIIGKELLTFLWGIVIMQFLYGFIFTGIKKFIVMRLSSKLILLLLSLSKRYLIDNIIMVSINNNFVSHIKKPISKLFNHYNLLIKGFSFKKKILIFSAALGIPLVLISPILYFVGVLTFILEKLFSANMWKAILLWFLNAWDSLFAPIIEVLIFTWILGVLEKIPFIGKLIRPIYIYFNKIVLLIKDFLNKYFHKNIKKGFGKAIFKINYHVDITILKSENKKLLLSYNKREQKTIKNYIKHTMKTNKIYTFNKRLNLYLKSKKTIK